MSELRKFTPFGRVRCKQYDTEAEFFLEEPHAAGKRLLMVRYANGAKFTTAVPDDWSEEDLRRLLLEPMNPEAPYPAWEVPARAYGSAQLFRWWAGEKIK